MTKKMDMESLSMLTMINFKDIGKTAKDKDKDFTNIRTVMLIMDIGKTT